ncbi:hypothetical protein L2E82_22283 [Cichorium intybus]|uniref:Uncharacterized protein n=1 Tax=Cichorium intybus TaxID=13427 RepID=A0ACB9DXR0_CICIN|nr:hypothetical protein L2E82_22283 [Cichorium intybus]
MATTTGTTPKALQYKLKQEGTTVTNGGGESSFRVLYYGDASAGSVPFMWESHPGKPKHPTTESSLRPLTPPPAFRCNSSKPSTSLRTLFITSSSRKTDVRGLPAAPSTSTSDSSISYDDSSKPSTSLRSLFLASGSQKADVSAAIPLHASLSHSLPSTPMSKGREKTEFRRRRATMKLDMDEDGGKKHVGGDGSPTSTLCFGGGLMKFYRMKKAKGALMSIGSHGIRYRN